MKWSVLPFEEAVTSRGSGTQGLPQSEWRESGDFPVIGQGAEAIEGWTDRKDLLITPDPALVLYGGHTRRAKYVDRPFVPGPNVKILSPVPGIDPKFLYWFLVQLVIESRGYADHFPQVRRCEIPVPPLPQQRRIAAILDAVDALRAKRRESIEQLDSLVQATFMEMFGDPVTNPKGWKVNEVAGVVRDGTSITYGIVQAGEDYPGGVPYIRTGDIVDGEIMCDRLRRTAPSIAAKFERSRVQVGDIVISIRATVGTAAIVTPLLDGANLTQGTARIAPSARIQSAYLLSYIKTAACQQWIRQQVKGATFQEITLARLRQMPVLMPPLDLQTRFASIVEAIEQQKARLKAHLAELDALLASLQTRAFNGELAA